MFQFKLSDCEKKLDAVLSANSSLEQQVKEKTALIDRLKSDSGGGLPTAPDPKQVRRVSSRT